MICNSDRTPNFHISSVECVSKVIQPRDQARLKIQVIFTPEGGFIFHHVALKKNKINNFATTTGLRSLCTAAPPHQLCPHGSSQTSIQRLKVAFNASHCYFGPEQEQSHHSLSGDTLTRGSPLTGHQTDTDVLKLGKVTRPPPPHPLTTPPGKQLTSAARSAHTSVSSSRSWRSFPANRRAFCAHERR